MKWVPARTCLTAKVRRSCASIWEPRILAWLVRDHQIIARHSASAGVRDSARTGDTRVIQSALRDLISSMQSEAKAAGLVPTFILGAGMITSSLGLFEIDHVLAPAGEQELAKSMRRISSANITELPIWLAPGVRTGSAEPELSELPHLDLIRGEETLCVGLRRMAKLQPQATLLNLGSHWKAITLDAAGRIATSFTTLSGELIHAIQQHTVLSSALPKDRFTDLDLRWLEKGREQQELSGLSRALFCIRILEQKFKLTALQLSSFLLGSVVGSDIAAALKNGKLGSEVVITGEGAAVGAWKHLLEAENHTVSICDLATIESAFVAGLLRLAELRQIT